MHIGANGHASEACETREAALAAQALEGPCSICDLSGLVTLYHEDYDGLPTMRITVRSGEEKEVPARIIGHCSCEVGKWIRSRVDAHALKIYPPLAAVGHGKLKNWSSVDPRFMDVDDTQPPDWKAFLRWLRSLPENCTERVYPKYEGNRNQARREMGVTVESK